MLGKGGFKESKFRVPHGQFSEPLGGEQHSRSGGEPQACSLWGPGGRGLGVCPCTSCRRWPPGGTNTAKDLFWLQFW